MIQDFKMENGMYVCPHNDACRCKIPTCNVCGWNPKVAEARMEKFKKASEPETDEEA